jgi:signal transduction histidine kinase
MRTTLRERRLAVRKDGTSYWANVIVTSLYEAGDQLRGYAMVIRDLTDRKRVESLEQTERQINEFLAMLGHELRNPLAPIRNALDLMRINAGTDPTHEWARSVIDRQVTQLSRLVDDLLDVSRITRARRQREPRAQRGRRQRGRCKPVAHRGARRRRRTSSEPVPVEADFTRLSQVVMNLLNNAAKYTPHGGQIRISVGREGRTPSCACATMASGCRPRKARVFDLFVQGDRSLDRAEGGLGIGLTPEAADRASRRPGRGAERRPGTGSEFVFRLPSSTRCRRRPEPGER